MTGPLVFSDNHLGRTGRQLSRYRAKTGRLAQKECAGSPRGIHPAGASPQTVANHRTDETVRPAGTQAAHRQGQGLARRRRPSAAGQRRAGRNRREMGLRRKRPTSRGNARMRDPLSAEFPDNRLLNRAVCGAAQPPNRRFSGRCAVCGVQAAARRADRRGRRPRRPQWRDRGAGRAVLEDSLIRRRPGAPASNQATRLVAVMPVTQIERAGTIGPCAFYQHA